MVREFAKGLLPPLAARTWRRLRPPAPRFHGVFESSDEVGGPSPWDTPSYLADAEARLVAIRAARRPEPDFLPTAALIGALAQAGACRVLDFAGGTGLVYHAIRPWLGHPAGVCWDVVDNPRLAEIGRRRLEPTDAVHFLPELPDVSEPYDVVHVNTSLQYLDEPQVVLERLCDYAADWLLLTRLLASEKPTFLTSQVVQGARVACWFLNAEELIGRLAGRGYALVLRSPVVDGDFEGSFAPSVPESLRPAQAIHMFFRRDAGAARA